MKKLSLMILAGFVAFSCAKEPVSPDNGQTKGGLSITFTASDYSQVGTRAMNESALSDVTILQFKNGVVTDTIHLSNTVLTGAINLGSRLTSMNATQLDENGVLIGASPDMLVFLANVNAATGAFPTLGIGTTYAQLQAYTLNMTDAATLSAAQYMPMTGYYYGGIVAGVTNQINASLTRSLAKINFTLNTDYFVPVSGTLSNISIKNIELRNVPTVVTMYNANRPALPVNGANGIWPNGGGVAQYYPAVATATLNKDMNLSTSTDLTKSFVAYMPENARGSYPAILNNLDKKPTFISLPEDTQVAPNASGLTYIFVDLDYTTSEGIIANATYKIYLGGNATGDMNILGNTTYNVTTYLYGANKAADTRITFEESFNPSGVTVGGFTPQKNANSYIINTTPAAGSFILPITQAKLGWSYISSSTSDLTKAAAFDELIAGPDWEIITLWRTWGSGDAASNITGVKSTGATGGTANAQNFFATLTFPAGITDGNNAVIALVKASDHSQIFWSWHLWFTDYNPAATPALTTNGELHKYFSQSFTSAGFSNGKYIMDRNFGATHTGGTINSQPQTVTEAAKTYGMMYQWGRKDPFTPSTIGTTAMTTANTVAIYNSLGVQLTGTGNDIDGFPKKDLALAAVSQVANAVQNPMNYYFNALNSDWTMLDNNLWSKTAKTAFDPCPAGWRVPAGSSDAAYNPWAGFADNNPGSTASIATAAAGNNVFTWNATVAGQAGTAGRLYDRGAQDASGVKAWYPASGNRNTASGAFYGVGSYGYSWGGSVTGTYGYSLSFGATDVYPANNYDRASGFPIRCIQE